MRTRFACSPTASRLSWIRRLWSSSNQPATRPLRRFVVDKGAADRFALICALAEDVLRPADGRGQKGLVGGVASQLASISLRFRGSEELCTKAKLAFSNGEA